MFDVGPQLGVGEEAVDGEIMWGEKERTTPTRGLDKGPRWR
jgi:hypothetical protein